jgi:hypothetical protein
MRQLLVAADAVAENTMDNNIMQKITSTIIFYWVINQF